MRSLRRKCPPTTPAVLNPNETVPTALPEHQLCECARQACNTGACGAHTRPSRTRRAHAWQLLHPPLCLFLELHMSALGAAAAEASSLRGCTARCTAGFFLGLALGGMRDGVRCLFAIL